MVLDMLTQVFQMNFFGNEVWRYVLFLIIICLSFPIGKFLNYIMKNFLLKWAQRSKFKFDDILVGSLNPPITMFTIAGLFFLAMSFLNENIATPILMKIFNFLLIIPVVYFLIKFSTGVIGYYLKGDGKGNKKVNEAAIDLLMQIINIGLFIIGILLILANLGYNISALLAGLGVGGLAFALAAQDLLKNFFAGISLIFDKTFGKGERVKFETYSGRIEELKLRSTKLRTYDGTLLTIPNTLLAENIVENVTKVPRVKVAMTIGVTYDTPSKKLKEAKKIILDAIKKEEHADEESAWIYFDNFSAYSLDIQVIYYSKDLTMNDWPARVEMKERVNFAIKEGFESAKISMAFPTQTIEVKKTK